MAVLYKVDGSEVVVSPQSGTQFSLEELQSFVEGYIEIINLPDSKIAVVNEEGLLIRKQFNSKASLMAQRNLVGNVLICNREEVE